MAGGFLFQKFASGMWRSTSRLSDPIIPHASVAARYLGTSPWSRAATKAGWPTTGMPSTVVKKPTFLVSVGGIMKRAYSSGAPNKLGETDIQFGTFRRLKSWDYLVEKAKLIETNKKILGQVWKSHITKAS
ncbi:hypothetical protein PVAP13_6KG326500 [Panicum virgatum]|uniref:Uncharacterized protein n=1 Tax=Panicum virgatum TaxID=38727 RepID=A0A8T0RFE6_PANVG|nr:hypothetical protein PVAP13_6KG326500 [Panicum virgatum]KAG2584772.1 hypothetical protein PVAP13_6KG326500 [Panicum virgatum]